MMQTADDMQEDDPLLSTDENPQTVNQDGDYAIVTVPSVGFRQFYGISSSYCTKYPLELSGIVSREDFEDIISRLNETIRNHWPCHTCYLFGYGFSLCTFGLSMILPSYCMSTADFYANEMLKHVSLKAKFYEKKITFTIQKGFLNSYIEIRFPAKLLDNPELKELQSMNYLIVKPGESSNNDLLSLFIDSVIKSTGAYRPKRS